MAEIEAADVRGSVDIKGEDDPAYQELANECGRRVWTTMQNLIEVRSRKKKNGVLEGVELKAILMGSISGIACHVARMDLKIENPTPDVQPVEILLLNDLGTQFLHTIEQLRANDPIAMMMTAKEGEGGHT